MRILISGGYGFIGSRLADHLSKVGHEILLGSRYDRDPPVWLPQAKVVKLNWDEGDELRRSCEGVNVVIQAAGLNAQDCILDPVEALSFNGVATSRLFSNAIQAGVQKFIYLSTAHVYTSPLIGNITENSCPRNLHPYATSHHAGENAVLDPSYSNRIQSLVLRLSNSFGVPMQRNASCWMLLVNDLCRQAVERGSLELRSSGNEMRDFIGLDTVCCVIEHIISGLQRSIQSGIFNLGSGVSSSVMEMARIVQERCSIVLGFEPQIKLNLAASTEEVGELNYSIEKLKSIVSYQARNDKYAEIDNLLRYCETKFFRN